MPYSFPNNIPSYIKNLPKSAQRIFIETFNAVYKETKDENAARQAGWRNVKLKYKKVGNKWVKKTSALLQEYEELFKELFYTA